jgi:CCR4-NOT transcription complex subunit 3
MERFKACEKEMKTKAFSKEGLSAAAKLDPKEQQKVELCQWITTMVDELSRQVEQTEAEIESLQLLKKKKDSDREQRLEDLEALNDRREWHVGRLELILRLLENGNLQTDSVASVKDDIAYFVESNTVSPPRPGGSGVETDDFGSQEEDFEEDEGIYDDLNLQEEEENNAFGGDDMQSHDSVSVADDAPSIPPTPAAPSIPLPPRTPAKESAAVRASTAIDDKSPNAARGKVAPPPSTQRKATLDSTTQRPVLATPTRSISGSSTGVPAVRATPTPLPPIRYAAAAAAANVSSAPPPPAPVFAAPAPVVSQPPPGLYPVATAPAASPSGPNTGSRQASNVSSPELAKANAPTASQSASSTAPSPMMAPRLPPNLDTSSPALSTASLNVRPLLHHFTRIPLTDALRERIRPRMDLPHRKPLSPPPSRLLPLLCRSRQNSQHLVPGHCRPRRVSRRGQRLILGYRVVWRTS